jgi:FAD/FMN-containing dehydrogenase
MRPVSRRIFLASGAASAALLSHVAPAQTIAAEGKSRPLLLNDASGLNPVPVARNWIVRSSDEQHFIDELRSLLKEATREGKPVCFGGARHSMGGQSLVRDGFAASIAAPSCLPDAAARTYRVRSGTRWRDVIEALDPLGFSVAVMQSNHDFSVGGTLSVNAHGWAVPFGPFGTTIRSFRLMLSDGSVVNCTRTDNAELFALVIGGYGLFGIVIDADLDLVENVSLVPKYEVMHASAIAERFLAAVREQPVRMAYARLSIARKGFLGSAFLVTYRPAEVQPDPLPPARLSAVYAVLSRTLFRHQIGSERGKAERWYAETVLQPGLIRHAITRNSILNVPVSALADTDLRRTDILHEYFIPPARFGEFLVACHDVIPASEQALLNVTLRYVDTDPVSVLNFALGPRIAAVLLFTQPVSAQADVAMQAMTQRLIDRVLAIGGSFYLPYRLHARPDQVQAAYPRLAQFIAKKRHYDPQLRFRNLMWDKYFA